MPYIGLLGELRATPYITDVFLCLKMSCFCVEELYVGIEGVNDFSRVCCVVLMTFVGSILQNRDGSQV